MKSIPAKGLLHIMILSLIKDSETHGGEIYRNLKDKFGIDVPKPIIYTLLRRMEYSGFIVSKWVFEGGGPAKRVYKITVDGLDYLKGSLDGLRKIRLIVDKLLELIGE